MQPGTSVSARSRRFHNLVRPFVRRSAALVLVSVVLGSLPGFARAQAEQRYEPIPARRWSADEVRRLPDGQERIERELRRQGEYSRRWNLIHDLVGGQHVSTKSRDILKGRGLGPALLDKGTGLPRWQAGTQAGEDTLNVLIIRIGFETNRDPHLTTIDPSGDFVLEPLTDPQPLEVDPPPRNKAFFESHLDGLSEFYRFMSGGRLHIEGRVLPEGSDDSYKLTDVADYGPGADNFWTLESLERLVQDMMRKADQETQADGSVNLADYDDNSPFTYIIFVHAGSDWQSDVNGDSPNDIPTFFVTLGEPIDLIGTNANGEPGQLSECSIIPETTNQDGYPGSIAAAFYHEFGHALGLPDVYSTYSGLPSVGIWDLMDSGTNLPVTMGTITAENDTFVISATGVLPPSISAWNKWFLGWLEMGELDGSEDDFLLPAVGVPVEDYWLYPEFQILPDDTQAFRAGLSPREWFLLENRWVPVDASQTPYVDLRFERDIETGVITYLAGQRQGEWSNSGLYDYFMPPGGVLVWHVNDDRITEGLEDNTINIYNDGLKLVEGDGIQDIGVLEAYVLGWYGSYRDPFGGVDPNGNRTGYDTLHIEGFPSSRAFDRSWTGLSLTEIGPRTKFTDSVMKFKAGLGPVGPGFPYELPPVEEAEFPGSTSVPGPRPLDPASLTTAILAGGTQQVAIFSDAAHDGWSDGDYPATLFHRWSDGGRRWVSLPDKPEGAFQELGAPLSGSPFTRERVDADGVDLVWGTTAGRIGSTHLPEYNMPAEAWTFETGGVLSGGPLPVVWQGTGGRTLVLVEPDQLLLLDGSGAQVGEALTLTYPSDMELGWIKAAAPIPGDGGTDMVPVYSEFGWWLVRLTETGQDPNLDPDPIYYSYGDAIQTRRADPNYHSAVVATGDGHQLHILEGAADLGPWMVASDGTVNALDPVLDLDAPLVTEPAVADVDGDGHDDLVLLTGDRVRVVRPDGVTLRGFPVRLYDLFPLPDSTRVDGPVVVADATGDGVNEVYFNTEGGHLVGLDATGRLLPQTPMRWGDRRTAGLAVGGPVDGRVLWLASPGGYTGPPLDRQFVNGRLTAYSLTSQAPEGSRTSEWQGPLGGSLRRGTAGEAGDLGPSSPAAAETDKVIFYPSPISGNEVTIRFYSAGDDPARVVIYNLEGEEIVRAEFSVTADVVNEYVLSLPPLASGLYLARLDYEDTGGRKTKTMTLAVEK